MKKLLNVSKVNRESNVNYQSTTNSLIRL